MFVYYNDSEKPVNKQFFLASLFLNKKARPGLDGLCDLRFCKVTRIFRLSCKMAIESDHRSSDC